MKYNLPKDLSYINLNRYATDICSEMNNMSYDIIVNIKSDKDIINSFMYAIACKMNPKHIISTYEYNSIVEADDDIHRDDLKEAYINGYNDIQRSYESMINEDDFEYSKISRHYLRFFKEINWSFINTCSFDELVEIFNMKNVLVITDTNDINVSSINIYKLGVKHLDVLYIK